MERHQGWALEQAALWREKRRGVAVAGVEGGGHTLQRRVRRDRRRQELPSVSCGRGAKGTALSKSWGKSEATWGCLKDIDLSHDTDFA